MKRYRYEYYCVYLWAKWNLMTAGSDNPFSVRHHVGAVSGSALVLCPVCTHVLSPGL
jgi:hypothetical protein